MRTITIPESLVILCLCAVAVAVCASLAIGQNRDDDLPDEMPRNPAIARGSVEEAHVMAQSRWRGMKAEMREANSPRVWTDAIDKHKTHARYGGVKMIVQLSTIAGKAVEVPLEKLSEDDQLWVLTRLSNQLSLTISNMKQAQERKAQK
jgi:SLA1 homology domain 1, SHD1